MLAVSTATDAVGEIVRMGESTCLDIIVRFPRAMVKMLGVECLREPTVQDIEWLMSIGAARGFPSMLGSIDCMHW